MGKRHRRHLAESKLRVALQFAIVPFQHRHSVFAVLQAEIEERGLAVERVPQHGVKESGVVGKYAFEQPAGRGDFSLTRSQQFDVQRQGQIVTHQMADNSWVVILGDRFPVDCYGPLQTVWAMPPSTGKKIRGHPRRRIAGSTPAAGPYYASAAGRCPPASAALVPGQGPRTPGPAYRRRWAGSPLGSAVLPAMAIGLDRMQTATTSGQQQGHGLPDVLCRVQRMNP